MCTRQLSAPRLPKLAAPRTRFLAQTKPMTSPETTETTVINEIGATTEIGETIATEIVTATATVTTAIAIHILSRAKSLTPAILELRLSSQPPTTPNTRHKKRPRLLS